MRWSKCTYQDDEEKELEFYMSKLNNTIREIEYLDDIAKRDQWVNNINPLVKLFITVIYLLVVVSFHKYDIFGIASMAVYPILMFSIADLSFMDALKRLKVVLPLVCVVGIFNPFFDRAVIVKINGWEITGGEISMLTLMIKGILTVLSAYILIATTTIERICYGLRRIHIPKIIVTEIMLIYRYITVLIEETKKITQAYFLRAPRQKGVHYKAWGSMVGQLLLRSMDRAEIVYESMCLRGFSGEFFFESPGKFSIKEALFMLIWGGCFILFRLFPVFETIGGLL